MSVYFPSACYNRNVPAYAPTHVCCFCSTTMFSSILVCNYYYSLCLCVKMYYALIKFYLFNSCICISHYCATDMFRVATMFTYNITTFDLTPFIFQCKFFLKLVVSNFYKHISCQCCNLLITLINFLFSQLV